MNVICYGERFSSRTNNVIDCHGYSVNAYSVIFLCQLRYQNFGAYPFDDEIQKSVFSDWKNVTIRQMHYAAKADVLVGFLQVF